LTKQRIKFIINPNSGVKNKKIVLPKIQKYLDNRKYDYDIVYTEFAGHAKKLSAEAVKDGFQTVVSVGGDGSVSEVAASLIGTDVNLGILPMGSGNGFAMHTGIGRKLVKAIQVLNTGKIVRIDTCIMNGKPFINLCGLGFDGLVAKAFKEKTKRGFISYLQLSLEKAFSTGFHQVKLRIDNEEVFNGEVFLIEIANGAMFGYNFVVVPAANLTNGYLDILLIKKANKLRLSTLVPRLLLSSLDKSKIGGLVETYQAKKVELELNSPAPMHYDGEGFIQNNNKVVCAVVPKSLNVILPQNGKY
jgi:YegS/Rv2252/BmrU family lipid kinase